MDKDMASAFDLKVKGDVKRLAGTGIKLTVTEKDTGKEVNYGVQLNNTTLEIEALPNLIVDVKGHKEMLEVLKLILSLGLNDGRRLMAEQAIAKAEGKK